MRRTTIKDIARVAGVSVGAASFALNDRPGVSEATRARVKQVAHELGWQRSAAAAALSAKNAGAVGMVLQRSQGEDYTEAFVLRFIAGIHQVLRPLQQSLVLQSVVNREEELETYRTWWGERRVDGVLLLRPSDGDGRAQTLEEIGMPAVVVGDRPTEHIGAVCADETGTTRLLVEHFAALGHRRIAYVTGPQSRPYLRWRSEAFQACATEHGMTAKVVHLDSEDELTGMQASQRLVRGPLAPTAILYDNELLAMGGVAACHDAGLKVGRDVCMATFEDSPACRMQRPAISALRRQTETIGAMATRSLLELVGGGSPQDLLGPMPDLAVRGSSGQRRATAGAAEQPVPLTLVTTPGPTLALVPDAELLPEEDLLPREELVPEGDVAAEALAADARPVPDELVDPTA